MSDPPSSSKVIVSEKPGGTSPSPVEGVESVAGPSDFNQILLGRHQNELDPYGESAEEEEEEEEENSTEEDNDVCI